MLAQGAVVDVITAEAEAMPADLVVFGARGTDFLRRLVFGSTAERLLRKSTRPMLVVKQRAREPYRRALVAVDFSAWSVPLDDLARSVAPDAQTALERDLLGLIDQFNRSGDGTLVVPGEYLEIVITRN